MRCAALCVFFCPRDLVLFENVAPQSGASFRAQAPSLVPMYTRIPSQTQKAATHLGPDSGHECWAMFSHKKWRRRSEKKQPLQDDPFTSESPETKPLKHDSYDTTRCPRKKPLSISLQTTCPATAFQKYVDGGKCEDRTHRGSRQSREKL
jgi:hypothetical protein